MFHHCHVLYPIPLTSGFARLCKTVEPSVTSSEMVGEVTQKGYKPPWQQHHDNRMPSPSALYKQLTFLEMASFWHSHGSRITRKAWLTWIETKRGYFDDMVAVSFFENFELIYWFLDVPQMTIHLNWTSQPSHHYARLKVPSFLFGDFKRHFSTNRLTLNRDRAKLLNLWGQPKFLHHRLGSIQLCNMGKLHPDCFMSFHIQLNAVARWCVLSLRWSWHFSRPTFTKGSWCETTELLLAITYERGFFQILCLGIHSDTDRGAAGFAARILSASLHDPLEK